MDKFKILSICLTIFSMEVSDDRISIDARIYYTSSDGGVVVCRLGAGVLEGKEKRNNIVDNSMCYRSGDDSWLCECGVSGTE